MGTYVNISASACRFSRRRPHRALPVAVLASIGIITCLVAMVQPNLKKLGLFFGQPPGFRGAGHFHLQTISMQGRCTNVVHTLISTARCSSLTGVIYDRRHTDESANTGALATPMPKYAAFFLFVALSSLGSRC